MGVGTYESDFDGSGETFIVSPDFYNTQEDYEKYCADFSGSDGDEPLDFEDWAQQNVDDFEDRVNYALEAALGRIGGFHAGNPRDRERFGADAEFSLIFRGNDLDVGLRGWETDYVVAVAPTREHVRSLVAHGEEYDGETQNEFGCTLDELRDAYQSAVSALAEIAVQALIEDGVDCRYKTSGYTSSAYVAQEGFDFDAMARIARREPDCAPAP